ncbi:MAG TPA: hypothetical protein VKR58_03185 [Aquella sp.]|nr:hypothetical protein [Aquella sp.]
MEFYKFVGVTVDLLNPAPTREPVVLKSFVKPKTITAKTIDLAIEKAISDSWTEVGKYIRFGIKQEKQRQCLPTIK